MIFSGMHPPAILLPLTSVLRDSTYAILVVSHFCHQIACQEHAEGESTSFFNSHCGHDARHVGADVMTSQHSETYTYTSTDAARQALGVRQTNAASSQQNEVKLGVSRVCPTMSSRAAHCV